MVFQFGINNKLCGWVLSFLLVLGHTSVSNAEIRLDYKFNCDIAVYVSGDKKKDKQYSTTELDDSVSVEDEHTKYRGEVSSYACSKLKVDVEKVSAFRTKFNISSNLHAVGGYEINKIANAKTTSSGGLLAKATAYINSELRVTGHGPNDPVYLLVDYSREQDEVGGGPSEYTPMQEMVMSTNPALAAGIEKYKSYRWIDAIAGEQPSDSIGHTRTIDGFEESFLLVDNPGKGLNFWGDFGIRHGGEKGKNTGESLNKTWTVIADLLSYDTCDSKYDYWDTKSELKDFREAFCAVVRLNIATSPDSKANAKEWSDRETRIRPRLEFLDKIKKDPSKPRLAKIADLRLSQFWVVAHQHTKTNVVAFRAVKDLVSLVKSPGPTGLFGFLDRAKDNLQDRVSAKKDIKESLDILEKISQGLPSSTSEISQFLDMIRVSLDADEMITKEDIEQLKTQILSFLNAVEDLADRVITEGNFYAEMARPQ